MGKITLVTGGCRSGKSRHAQELAMARPGRRCYVATCPVIDEEMARRIDVHRREREGQGWTTIEALRDLMAIFRDQCEFDVFLVDCVTLWINNLLFEAGGDSLTEEEIAALCEEMLAAAARSPADVIFVTNEVGQGIVPENQASRHYRDLVGRANQTIAARADAVTLVVAGIPMPLKQVAG